MKLIVAVRAIFLVIRDSLENEHLGATLSERLELLLFIDFNVPVK